MRCCRRRRTASALRPRPKRRRTATRGRNSARCCAKGKLDDKEIEIEIQAVPVGVEIMAPPGMEEMTSQLQGMFQNLGGNRRKTRKLKVKDALKQLTDEEAAKIVDEEELKTQALEAVEQHGIVFLDELDKVARRSGNMAPTYRARACSVTCCRSSRVRPSIPSTAW